LSFVVQHQKETDQTTDSVMKVTSTTNENHQDNSQDRCQDRVYVLPSFLHPWIPVDTFFVLFQALVLQHLPRRPSFSVLLLVLVLVLRALAHV
jgi:hypothetical protein